LAIGEGSSEEARKIGLAYAKGIGGTRGRCPWRPPSPRKQRPTCLASRSSCAAGSASLVKAAFETLVESGNISRRWPISNAFHELKLIVDLFYQGGLNYIALQRLQYGGVRRLHARTAHHHRRDPRGNERESSRKSRPAQFAREWILENRAGAPVFKAHRRRERAHWSRKSDAGCGRLMPLDPSEEV